MLVLINLKDVLVVCSPTAVSPDKHDCRSHGRGDQNGAAFVKKLTELGLLTRVTQTDDAGEERIVCDLSGLGRLEHYVFGEPDYQARKYPRSADLVEEAAP